MKMRKITAAVLAGVMIVLSGCGGNEETSDIEAERAELSEMSERLEAFSEELVSMSEEVAAGTAEDVTSEEVSFNDTVIETGETTAPYVTPKTDPTTTEIDRWSYAELVKRPEIGLEVRHDYVYHLNKEDFPYDSEEIEIIIGGWGDDEEGYKITPTYGYVDLSELVNYTKLKRLSINHSTSLNSPIYMVNYETLFDMDSLDELHLSSVEFDDESINIKPLKKLTNIKVLELRKYSSYNVEIDWDVLKELTFVEELTLYRCDVKDADFINYMTSLRCVSLYGNDIADYSTIKENAAVESLISSENWFYEMEFDDISNLKNLSNLKYLCVAEHFSFNYSKEDIQKIKDEFQEVLPECEIIIN